MGESLAIRYKSYGKDSCHGTLGVTDDELERGFAYRKKMVCDRYYRVGDIRKANEREDGYSYGVKVRITDVSYDRKAKRTKVSFEKIDEHKREIPFKLPKGFYNVE